MPSNTIIRSSRAAEDVCSAGSFGVRVPDGVEVDFPAVMERMRKLRSKISFHDSTRRFHDLGIDVFLGEGRFTGMDSVQVAGKRVIHPYPTQAEAIKQVADMYNRTRLTSFVRKVFAFWLGLCRLDLPVEPGQHWRRARGALSRVFAACQKKNLPESHKE